MRISYERLKKELTPSNFFFEKSTLGRRKGKREYCDTIQRNLWSERHPLRTGHAVPFPHTKQRSQYCLLRVRRD